jgi:UDP-N-acetylglucosamine 2-epimerase (non-hydrolysing)
MHRVLSVVGTRPNFMKVAPVAAALAARPTEFEHTLVHTGQHYDAKMSDIFFEQLGVGEPDVKLEVGPGSHAVLTARIMERIEPVLLEAEPDIVLVPGDVNSTLAAAIVATKLGIPVGHIEAGLRSFDRTMPEELNRVMTDAISDALFIHSPEARDHLLNEGALPETIHSVGNTMIDTLVALREPIAAADTPGQLGLEPGGYLAVTLHRPALVDGELLREAVTQLQRLSEVLPIVFPCHPRTRNRMTALGLDPDDERLRLLEPLGYLEFLSLVGGSAGVLTDSGGIQEETTYLGIPCFTLRANTERPVTVEQGTNTLLGLDPARIGDVPQLLAAAGARNATVPAGWDGRAAERIADVLADNTIYASARVGSAA